MTRLRRPRTSDGYRRPMHASPARLWSVVVCAFAVVLFCSLWVHGQPKVPAKPVPPRLINDLAGMLTSAETQEIEERLLALNEANGVQFAVVTVPDMGGYSIEEYSVELFQKWGIGEAKEDNGLLLLIADEEGRLRFETGYGLEGDLPDAFLGRVIDENLVPHFVEGDPAAGIVEAVNTIALRLAGGEIEPSRKEEKSLSPDALAAIVFFAIVIVYLIVKSSSRKGPSGRPPKSGGGVRRPPSTPGPFMGRGWKGPSGGSSRGSSGGFGGFGGGRSGGGGASGGWK
ncbi:MAG: TPM domain-containing protein [Firmicutes bacterium]|nr:TPM domain-containing protein [Bacillota bacterium]MDD4791515.1 TPM domain-containing protein [Bacillota bacterium]